MLYLLDTNAVIAILNNPSGPVASRLRRQSPDDIVLGTIVLFELYYGAFRSSRVAGNLAVLDALRFTILDFNAADARATGDLRATLAAAGTPIGPYDLLIAAQGIARGLIVITANTREFVRAEGLTVEDWS